MEPAGPGYVRMQVDNSGTSINWPSAAGWKFPITADKLHEEFEFTVTTDPNLKSIVAEWYGHETMINHYLAGDGPPVVKTSTISPGAALPVVTVVNVDTVHANASMSLCRSLTQSH
jgi:hypothetical protein